MLVSFVVIALNAEKSIENLFNCLTRQSYNHSNIEVVLVDSDSSDSTRELMNAFKAEARGFRNVKVLSNPKKTLPCGWNVALNAVEGDAVLRVDAHVTFPDEFISLNVEALEKGEDICGGKVISIPAKNDTWSKMINQAENSMFGGSFAAFRRADSARYVDTAAFAIYRREVFEKTGKYNELLTRTEDNDMHYRMRQLGYKFYYDPRIESYRETRATLSKLIKQKYLNGYWIGRTLKIQPKCFSLYHFVPFAFLVAIIVSALFAGVGIEWMMMALWIAYGLVDVFMSIASVITCSDRSVSFILLPFVFLALHLAYGVGTLFGLIDIRKLCKR